MNIDLNVVAAKLFFSDYVDKDPNEEIPSDVLDDYRNYADVLNQAMKAFFYSKKIHENSAEKEFQEFLWDILRSAARFSFWGTTEEEIEKLLPAIIRYMYVILFDRPQGPRMGAFIAIMGRDQFCYLFERKMENPFDINFDLD